MIEQAALPLSARRDPEASPLRVRLAVDTNGFVVHAGDRSAAYFDKLYPSCAPHYIADFVEQPAK